MSTCFFPFLKKLQLQMILYNSSFLSYSCGTFHDTFYLNSLDVNKEIYRIHNKIPTPSARAAHNFWSGNSGTTCTSSPHRRRGSRSSGPHTAKPPGTMSSSSRRERSCRVSWGWPLINGRALQSMANRRAGSGLKNLRNKKRATVKDCRPNRLRYY